MLHRNIGAPLADAAPFGKGVLASLDQIDALLAQWAPLVKPEDKAAFDKVVARTAEFRTFRSETVRLGGVDPAQANAQGNNDANRANRKAYQAEIDAVVQKDQADFAQLTADLETFRGRVIPAVLAATLIGILAGLGTAVFIATRHVVRPLSRITVPTTLTPPILKITSLPTRSAPFFGWPRLLTRPAYHQGRVGLQLARRMGRP